METTTVTDNNRSTHQHATLTVVISMDSLGCKQYHINSTQVCNVSFQYLPPKWGTGRISCFLSCSYIAHGNHSRNKALERGGGEDHMNRGEDHMNRGEGGRIT